MEGTKNVAIRTAFIPLDAFLKWAGAMDTGGMAKRVIVDGFVSVNGEICRARGRKLIPGDRVSFDGVDYLVCEEGKA
ncbi:MAG: RNA-binding S4 domain-containing protein [Clostridia bacterium]|nr:RNA-binding S4 domain-containing protein [Clostridia bacterium]